MGTEVARPPTGGRDRALSCVALGLATGGLVLLRPSGTLGVLLAECAVITALTAVTFLAAAKRGHDTVSSWGAVVVGFGGAVAMATLLGDAALAARSWIGALASGVGLVALVTGIGTGIADALSTAHPPQPLRDAVRQVAPRPVLLVAGAGEARQAEWYRQAAPGAVVVEHLPDVPHIGALAHDADWWRETVCGALDAALR